MTVASASANLAFMLALKNRIVTILNQCSCTFRGLIQHTEGAYPTDVRDALSELLSSGVVKRQGELLSAAGTPEDRVDNASDDGVRGSTQTPLHVNLPTPHPADFDWRFTPRSARRVGRLARAYAVESPICILGAPTAFIALAEVGVRSTLVERNPHVVRALASRGLKDVVEADILSPSNALDAKYGVVIADPPWYPEHYQSFISQASRVLLPEGILLISVLPRLTRPSAQEDRRVIAALALNAGFDLVRYVPSALRYQTPMFETASLRTIGVDCGDWRRADLAAFRLTATNRTSLIFAATPSVPSHADQGPWRSFCLNDHQIRVRVKADDSRVPFTVEPLGERGPVLTTVSRRNPVRERIDVWTAANEAWHVSRVNVVVGFLQELSDSNVDEALTRTRMQFRLSEAESVALEGLATYLMRPSEMVQEGASYG